MNCSWCCSIPIENCVTIQWPDTDSVDDIYDLVSASECCQLQAKKEDRSGPCLQFDVRKSATTANLSVAKDDSVKLEIDKISILSTSRRIEWYKVNENGDKEYVETTEGCIIEDTDDLTMYLCTCAFDSLNSCNHFTCKLIQSESKEYWLFRILIQVRYTKLPSLSSSVACEIPQSLGPLMASLLCISDNKSNALSPMQGIKENLLNLSGKVTSTSDSTTATGASSRGEENKEAGGKWRSTDHSVDHQKDDATNSSSISSSMCSKVTDALQSMDSRLNKIESILCNMDSRMQRLEQLVISMIHESPECT